MHYKLHIPFMNREDLLRDAIESARPIGNIHVWANTVPSPDIAGVGHHALPPLPNVAVFNLMIQSSWNDDVMLWLHNDGLILPGVGERFLSYVTERLDQRWGMVMTTYDVLCAFNMRAVREVGYWDTMFFQYTVDVDYYRRLLLANWPILQFGPGNNEEVQHRKPNGDPHGGSNTIQADPLYNYRIQLRNHTGIDGAYFMCKWGLHEKHWADINAGFKRPFDDFVATGMKHPGSWQRWFNECLAQRHRGVHERQMQRGLRA